jgi:hypothetical protein
MEVLEKHKRYLEHHVPGEVFWGIGIENETYVELLSGKEVTAQFIASQHTRERYSVNYWTQYKEGKVAAVLNAWMTRLPHGPNTPITLPLLMNGHTLTKCDPWGQHATICAQNPTPNPKYAKRTLLDVLETVEPDVFGPNALNHWWCFDGDTVEFMTQAFRCATVQETIAELLEVKARWMSALRTGLKTISCEATLKGLVDWPKKNHGLAIFLTNRHNVAIFNNGTYHINMTAPTRLGKDGEIEDWPRFQHIHRQAARLFQWISPFLIGAYGSGDVFAHISNAPCSKDFPVGSQRLAASRYVSVGTYDTRLMPRGKMVTRTTSEIVPSPLWWYEMYESRQVAYTKLDAIGYDINFNKYPNHGLEFRIFDWFGEERLGEVLEILVAMMDRAMRVTRDREVPFPQDYRMWRRVVGRVVWEGADALLSTCELRAFSAVLGIPELNHWSHRPVLECYSILRRKWIAYNGPCSQYMNPIPALIPSPIRITWMSDNTEIHRHHTQWCPPFHPLPIPLPHTSSVPTFSPVAFSQGCCLPLGFFAKYRTIR